MSDGVKRIPIKIEEVVLALRNGIDDEEKAGFYRDVVCWYVKNRIIPSHIKNVYHVPYHDDVVQDVLVHVFARLKRYDGRVKFITWIWAVVGNRIKTIAPRMTRFHERNVTFSRKPAIFNDDGEKIAPEDCITGVDFEDRATKILKAIQEFIDIYPNDAHIIKSLIGDPETMTLKPKVSLSEAVRETGQSIQSIKRVFEGRIKPFFSTNYAMEDF